MPSQLPADPMPDVAEAVAVLDLVEDDRARAHITRRYPPSQWRAQVAEFMFLGFIGGADAEGTPICIAGDRDAWMTDLKARRQDEAAAAERRRPKDDPGVRVEDLEQVASFCRVSARDNDGAWGRVLRERAIRYSVRARIGRARLAVRRLVPTLSTRPRAREHRAARSRRRSGTRVSRGSPAGEPPGEPEPPSERGRR